MVHATSPRYVGLLPADTIGQMRGGNPVPLRNSPAV